MKNRSINILLIKDGEIIPLKKNDRRMRVSHLMNYFKKNGYKTSWVTSNFLHSQRLFIKTKDLNQNENIILLSSIGYFNNKSPRRFIHTIFFSIKLFLFLIQKIRNFTHIYISYPTPESFFPTIFLTNLFKIPLIIDVRDVWPPEIKNGLIYFLYNKLTIFSMQRIRNKSRLYLLSVSEGLEFWFKKKFPNLKPVNSTICPIGCDDEFHGKRFKNKKEINIIYVGSLGINYDVIGIVKSLINSNHDDFLKIHIIGNGEQLKQLKELDSKKINLNLYGFMDKAQVKKISANCDIGLVPHKIDGLLPNKVGEYLCSGLFIISTIKGKCEELIQTNKVGFTVDREYKSIRKAIGTYKKLDKKNLFKNTQRIYNSDFFTENVYINKLNTLKEFIET